MRGVKKVSDGGKNAARKSIAWTGDNSGLLAKRLISYDQLNFLHQEVFLFLFFLILLQGVARIICIHNAHKGPWHSTSV